MKNALEEYRRENGLTYRGLASICKERSLYSVYRHCHGHYIKAESAMIYAKALGIPLSKLRPDLWPPDESQAASEKESA